MKQAKKGRDTIITRWGDKNGDLFRMGKTKNDGYFIERIKPAFTPNAGRVSRTYVSKGAAESFNPDAYDELDIY